MKRPTMLVQALLRNAALDLDLSVERDLQRVADRCEKEGMGFLTLTLPVLSDALERGIEAGTFTCPSNFARHGSLPRFLGGFFKRVFSLDGRLLPEVDPAVIDWIRQICRFFKKPKSECSEARKKAAVQSFLAIEGELRQATPSIERKDSFLDKISGIIWAQVFPELDNSSLVCRHGPGVTADRYPANARYRIRKWNHRSELTFPSDLHAFPNYGYAAEEAGRGIDDAEGINFLSIRDELPVRVVFVPKTLSAPRVIAIEPSHVQYMQQSLKDYCYKVLEEHALTKHSIRFRDQSVNQRLAYESSIDRRLATLDLKDASDRVHLHLVQRIFKNSGILEYLEDSRSLHATLPDGRNIVLSKFASMGSAMCFPVEAMVFYTLIQSAMHQLDGRRPSSRSVRGYSRLIDIYGDDIIVPVEYADVVVNYLESYALKVNVNKSFRNSHFRESCGGDFYNGHAVNPVYAREVPPDDSRHWGASQVMSWNATADLFYMKGKWHVAQVIRTMLSRVVRRRIPRSRVIGSGLHHFSFLFDTDLHWNADLQGWKQKRLVYQPSKKKDDIHDDDLACLNRWGISTWLRDGLGDQVSDLGDDSAKRLYLSQSLGRYSSRHVPSSLPMGDGEEAPCRVPQARSPVGGLHDGGNRLQDPGQPGRIPGDHDVPDEEGFGLPSESVGHAHGAPSEGLLEVLYRRQSLDFRSDHCLTESQGDPLGYLVGNTEGIDFGFSTKRGSFKSKCRWVSLAS